MEITFDRKSVNTCLQQRFTLPSYQREYRWEVKHLQDLLEDIQEQFLFNYSPTDGRSKVGEYSPYFLGTIITTPAPAGARSIVDGQQRLTTLSLILAYFYRLSKSDEHAAMSDVEPLLRRRVYGASEFNLEFDNDRHTLLELLLDRLDLEGDELDQAVESIPNASEGTKEVYRVFLQVDSFILDDIKEGLLDRFLDYLIERVYLFEIGVPSEQDGHKVFVTMNDRGLRLAPLDLLKGYLLSNIDEATANASANQKWAESIRSLRALQRDEDSAFFRTWLRAQYANSTRGKSRGSPPGDFEVVGDAYHRWVVENSDALGLNNSDDFHDLVERQIPFFVNQYKRIKEAETNFSSEYEHVYYNGAKNIALQYMAILSALDVNDTSSVVDKKIKLISFYVDAYITARVISRRGNNYDNIKDPIFALTRRVRRKSLSEIVDIIIPLMDEVDQAVDNLHVVQYWGYKRPDVLHILARIAQFLEQGLDLTNKVGFAEYINRGKGNKTFDVEHAIPYPSDILLGRNDLGEEVKTGDDTRYARHGIGGLLLLPRGRNRSMQSMSYPDKLVRYGTENILALSLTEGFYLNNPTVASLANELNLHLGPESLFHHDAIHRRGDLYREVAKLVWGRSHIAEIVG